MTGDVRVYPLTCNPMLSLPNVVCWVLITVSPSSPYSGHAYCTHSALISLPRDSGRNRYLSVLPRRGTGAKASRFSLMVCKASCTLDNLYKTSNGVPQHQQEHAKVSFILYVQRSFNLYLARPPRTAVSLDLLVVGGTPT